MMERMSSDQPPVGSAPSPPRAVVEFGPEPAERFRPERRRWSFGSLVAGLVADRRSVPLAAAVGGVALFASLISEWQITAIDTTDFGGTESAKQPVPAGVGDLGAFGGGYLVGLLVLVTAMVLVLFGPPAVRAYARLLGLSAGGVLLALLAAIYADLGDVSRSIERIYTLIQSTDIELAYGRGIWCAVFGVAALTLALYLAGRHTPAVPMVDDTAGVHDDAAPVAWSWRRPARPEEEEHLPDAPFDLSVSSTTPFTSLDDDRDKPVRRDEPGRGISG
jgi:hypothetical protein